MSWPEDIDYDRVVVARQIVSSKKKLKRDVPAVLDLARAIADINVDDTIRGSSTVTLTIADPEGDLEAIGFFDADQDGKLDPIDMVFPPGSRNRWRLMQYGFSKGPTTDLVFMERPPVYLMGHHGPVKMSRNDKTRAEFFEYLVGQVKAGGGIVFVSKDLHKTQPIENIETPDDKRDNKSQGIHPDENLKIKDETASTGQLREVERALDVAVKLNAPELAVIALLCAGIGESGFAAIPNAGGSNYWGVFQGSKDEFKINDTEGMAESFLKGGRGFQAGGAIALANAHPDMDPGEIATKVEASGEDPSFYGTYKDEAKALLEAYGGGFGGTVYVQQYNFEIGTEEDPHENFWDGMNRLADEVDWPLFCDGNRIFYDPETTLIKQRPAVVLHADDESIVDYDGDWDARHIATQMTLTLICDPFEFRAGEVIKFGAGFGPASTGSTAKLPGRWLIEEIEGSYYDLTREFTLVQPKKPKREPASDTAEREQPQDAGDDVSDDMTPKDIIDQIVLPIARECGIRITPLQVQQANAAHGPTVSGSRSDHQGPPEQAWAADMSNGAGPTPQMDRLARALIDKFDLPDQADPTATSGENPGNLVEKTAGDFRYQLIYRSLVGGNHYNHVHFGVRRIKAASNGVSGSQLHDALGGLTGG